MSGRTARAVVAAFLFAHQPAARAQDWSNVFHYGPQQLDCARFRETSRSRILAQSGGKDREQTAGRVARWNFRAAPAANGIGLEGWLDSLVLWRRSPETTIRPDTDGLLGGRYRGTLTPMGGYSGRVVPFIPDEVAEIAGMATALDDFFPVLPPHLLQPGQVWTDSAGVTVRRLADSALSGLPLFRFELRVRRKNRRDPGAKDTLPIELRQSSDERGTFVWHPTLGLLRRERQIVVETTVPAGPAVRQAIRSRVEQRITVSRDLTVPPASPGGCPTSS
ncbi:MAG TPA: hypothetical protein VFB61_05875 [Gemmatimonadales bacterium]|nr:hypothetical protein [Gemmatimonadales bacterium]